MLAGATQRNDSDPLDKADPPIRRKFFQLFSRLRLQRALDCRGSSVNLRLLALHIVAM